MAFVRRLRGGGDRRSARKDAGDTILGQADTVSRVEPRRIVRTVESVSEIIMTAAAGSPDF